MTLLKATLVNRESKGNYFSFKGYKSFYIKEGSGHDMVHRLYRSYKLK